MRSAPIGGVRANPDLPPKGMEGVQWGVPRGTIWARDRISDAAASKVRLAHVDQGYLNDCFLTAAMGALAVQRPEVLERMVVRRGDLVEVRLPGRTVVVDRSLPMWKGTPLFAASLHNRVLWPAYVEKAIASTYRDGYAKLDRGGDTRDAFHLLTGVRPQWEHAPEPGTYLEDIRARHRSGEAVVIGARLANVGSRRWRAMRQFGIEPQHSYVVQSVGGPPGDRTLRLWNIWGYDHPKLISERAFADLFDQVVTDRATYEF
jgi:hypothetical protein